MKNSAEINSQDLDKEFENEKHVEKKKKVVAQQSKSKHSKGQYIELGFDDEDSYKDYEKYLR